MSSFRQNPVRQLVTVLLHLAANVDVGPSGVPHRARGWRACAAMVRRGQSLGDRREMRCSRHDGFLGPAEAGCEDRRHGEEMPAPRLVVGLFRYLTRGGSFPLGGPPTRAARPVRTPGRAGPRHVSTNIGSYLVAHADGHARHRRRKFPLNSNERRYRRFRIFVLWATSRTDRSPVLTRRATLQPWLSLK